MEDRRRRRRVPWKSFAFALFLSLCGCLFFCTGAKILYFTLYATAASPSRSLAADSSSVSESSSPTSSSGDGTAVWTGGLPYLLYGVLLLIPGVYHIVLFLLAAFRVKGFTYSMIAFSGGDDEEEEEEESPMPREEEERLREEMRQWCMQQGDNSDEEHEGRQRSDPALRIRRNSSDQHPPSSGEKVYEQRERRFETSSSDDSLSQSDEEEEEDSGFLPNKVFTITGDGVVPGLHRRQEKEQVDMVETPTGKAGTKDGDGMKAPGIRRRR
eukprot:GHVS01051929.1.p1 GENE.GHVS01051929.1~~GHVS01051929.1.p1  ORF type:complete len:270 (+),score=57.15 GHVS01051929.1:167-976(+)